MPLSGGEGEEGRGETLKEGTGTRNTFKRAVRRGSAGSTDTSISVRVCVCVRVCMCM